MPTRHNSLSAPGFDYTTPGIYFVTVVCHQRYSYFGQIDRQAMLCNPAGVMAAEIWRQMPLRFPGVELDAFCVMPNHIHGLIVLVDSAQSSWPALPDILRAYKSISTHEYILGVRAGKFRPFEGQLWQRGYYDHIVRDDEDLQRIREYIENNPLKWDTDAERPNPP